MVFPVASGEGREHNATYHTQMSVDGRDSLVCAGLQQLRGDDLLDRQDDTVFASDADRSAAIFDRLHGVFDLKVTTVGGEDGVGEIVACSY